MLMVFSCGIAFAQDEAAAGNDSTALPVIEYGSMPRKYEIADISISGADNYEDFVLIGYSGLAVGDIISVPGDEVTNATKRFWRQGLFSDVKIYADKIEGDKIWLHIALKHRTVSTFYQNVVHDMALHPGDAQALCVGIHALFKHVGQDVDPHPTILFHPDPSSSPSVRIQNSSVDCSEANKILAHESAIVNRMGNVFL